jgi:hypothetical protein
MEPDSLYLGSVTISIFLLFYIILHALFTRAPPFLVDFILAFSEDWTERAWNDRFIPYPQQRT